MFEVAARQHKRARVRLWATVTVCSVLLVAVVVTLWATTNGGSVTDVVGSDDTSISPSSLTTLSDPVETSTTAPVETPMSAVETSTSPPEETSTSTIDAPIPALEASRRVDEYLSAIAADDYVLAAAIHIGEGGQSDRSRKLIGMIDGPDWEAAAESGFFGYCQQAACSAPYVLGEPTSIDARSSSVEVTFKTPSGPVAAEFVVGLFEGVLSVNGFPPPG